MFDFNPSFLVRLHPHRDSFHVSQGRTIFQVGSEGVVLPGSLDGLFVSKTRVLSVYRYFINGQPLQANVMGNIKQHSWLGYYIVVPPGRSGGGQDQGAGQVQEVSENTLELRVSRYVGEGVHEDLDLTNFTPQPTAFRLEIELDADFADQEELEGERQQRGDVRSDWRRTSDGEWELSFDYRAEHTYSHQGN